MQQVVGHALHVPLDAGPATAVNEGPSSRSHSPRDGGEHHLVDALRRHADVHEVLLQTALLHIQWLRVCIMFTC